MPRWIFEPGHTSATFRARHMMVSNVRGRFSDVHGWLEFDPDEPTRGAAEARIDANTLWSGEQHRDAHLKSEDFLDVENHPEIVFRGDDLAACGGNEFLLTGDLTLRGTTRPVDLEVRYLGTWQTPYWEDGEDRGPVRRIGFTAETRIDRHDFGASWDERMPRGGRIVSDEIWITLDVEALEEGPLTGE